MKEGGIENLEGYGEALSKESLEKKPKQHYFFTNNDISDRPVVFECYSDSDEEAEKAYIEKMGKERDKNYIGISIVIK